MLRETYIYCRYICDFRKLVFVQIEQRIKSCKLIGKLISLCMNQFTYNQQLHVNVKYNIFVAKTARKLHHRQFQKSSYHHLSNAISFPSNTFLFLFLLQSVKNFPVCLVSFTNCLLFFNKIV